MKTLVLFIFVVTTGDVLARSQRARRHYLKHGERPKPCKKHKIGKHHRNLDLKLGHKNSKYNKYKNRLLSGGGNIKAGPISVNFAEQPEPNDYGIKMTIPNANYPPFVVNPEKQNPLVIAPEVIYPHKVKRVILHHDMPLANHYSQMMNSMNPYWADMAKDNEHYKDIVEGSHALNSYMQSPSYTSTGFSSSGGILPI